MFAVETQNGDLFGPFPMMMGALNWMDRNRNLKPVKLRVLRGPDSMNSDDPRPDQATTSASS